MNIKFGQMRVFDAVARLGSFAEAARALHVSSAAVSLAVRELELMLGFRLFERTTRSVRLSAAGQQYYACVERVLTELRHAERCAQDLRSGKTDVVRIATTQAVISTLLPSAFRAFQVAWPDIRLYPLDIPGNEIAAALMGGQADVAIGVRLPSNSEFESRPFFSCRWHAYVDLAHPLAAGESLAWAQAVTEPLIVIGQTSMLKIRAALPVALKPRTVLEASTASVALSMAASGHGLAVAPGYLKPTAQLHGLRALPLTGPELVHELEISVPLRGSSAVFLGQVRDRLLAEVPQGAGALW